MYSRSSCSHSCRAPWPCLRLVVRADASPGTLRLLSRASMVYKKVFYSDLVSPLRTIPADAIAAAALSSSDSLACSASVKLRPHLVAIGYQ